MPEIHVPLIPVGENATWQYAHGRLAGSQRPQADVAIVPLDGVFLQTLRVKGNVFNKDSSIEITLYRTLKDDYLKSPLDVIASKTLTFSSPGVFNQSLPLASSGKNVVDNTLYNYTFRVTASTPSAGDLAFIAEVALLY